MSIHALRSLLLVILGAVIPAALAQSEGYDPDLRFRAIHRLREGLEDDEFWPSMHAAEGLTRAGFGDAVIHALKPRLASETDDQRRCGLAREQVRAGRLDPVAAMADILRNPDSNGRIHACESLFKVGEVGDRAALRKAMDEGDPILELMAAAALARQGDVEAFRRIRKLLSHAEARPRRTAAWVLGQIGDASDRQPIRDRTKAATDPLSVSFYWNALAKLGTPGAVESVVSRLEHQDATVRTYSAQTLGVCGNASHLPLLERLLDDPNADTGYRAAEAIIRITGRMLRRDQDKDGIPDCVEAELGTVANSPEELITVHTLANSPVPPPDADPEGQANTVRDIAACHVGADRYLFRVRFHRAISELRTVFHLYTYIDEDAQTGRRSAGPLQGVDMMYSFVDGKNDPRVFSPDLRVERHLPVRGIAAGDTIWICDDIRPAIVDAKAVLTVRTLTERYVYERCPRKVGRSTGPHRIVLPRQPRRQVPKLTFPQTRNMHEIPPSFPLLHRLRNAVDTVLLSSAEARVEGFIQHCNGDLESRQREAGRAVFHSPVAGPYRLAFLGRGPGALACGLTLRLDDVPLGSIAVGAVAAPGTLFFSDRLDLAADAVFRLETVPRSGPGRFGQFMLIRQTPEFPAMRIENLQSAILPAKPGEAQDRVEIVWTTPYPADCDITVSRPGHATETLPVNAPGPQVVHRFFLPDRVGDAARAVITVRTRASAEHAQVQASVTVPLRLSRAPLKRARRHRVPLILSSPNERPDHSKWPVTAGIPLAKGWLYEAQRCRIENQRGEAVPAQFRVQARWSDESVKWLLADFPGRIRAGKSARFSLLCNVEPVAPAGIAVRVEDEGDRIVLRNGLLSLVLDRNRFDPFGQVFDGDGKALTTAADGLLLLDGDGKRFDSLCPPDEMVVEERGPVRATVRIRGPLQDKGGARLMRYLCRLHAYAGMPFVVVEMTLENDVIDPDMNRLRSVSLCLRSTRTPARKADFGVGVGASLLQDYDNRCLVDGTPTDSPRASGYCGIRNAGLAVVVRDFWQHYPKGFRLENGSLYVDLLPPLSADQYTGKEDMSLNDRLYYWCREGRYTIRTGVRITTKLALYCGDTKPLGVAVSDRFQNPISALVTPEHACDSGVFGSLVPRHPRRFTRYEANIDKAFNAFLERRETVREYGFMNYGDWYGERTWNWGNVEYDTQHALALTALRTGNPAMLIRAEEAEAHNADIDTIHYASRPDRVGQVHTHCLGHTGGYFPPDFKTMGPAFANGSCSPGHTWSRGHFLLWALTGNERYRDTGEKVAYFQGALVARHPEIGFSRGGGWSLIGVTGAYQMSGDPFYLNAARVLASRLLEKQRPNGQWGHTIWESRDEFPMPWGCKPFMTGVIMHGLSMYDRIEPSPEVKDALVRGARYLWDNTYVPEDHGFIYAEAPKFMNRGGTWTLTLNGDGLARAAVIDSSPEYRRLLMDALRYNHYRAGVNSFGKMFTQGLCFMPYMLAELTRLGMTEPKSPGGEPPARILLRRHAVLGPRENITIRPACINSGTGVVRCSVTIPRGAKHWVEGDRKVSWQAGPGLSLGPVLTLRPPPAESTREIALKTSCGGSRRTHPLTLEVVIPGTLGTAVKWITGPGDHLANAARQLGLPVSALKQLTEEDLAACGTLIVGSEAFNKGWAECNRYPERLARFVARGGTLVVGQLNDAAWDPTFLPLDLYLSDTNSTVKNNADRPRHPLFAGTSPQALAGTTTYDTIQYADAAWTVLMHDAAGGPTVLEARPGAGRVLVLMPSFDRVVTSSGNTARDCRRLLTNLFVYATSRDEHSPGDRPER